MNKAIKFRHILGLLLILIVPVTIYVQLLIQDNLPQPPAIGWVFKGETAMHVPALAACIIFNILHIVATAACFNDVT